jgi:hypothetical protein
MSTDSMWAKFASVQAQEIQAFADGSDHLDVFPQPEHDPPSVWLVEFQCLNLVRPPGGSIAIADRCRVAIRLPSDYLARADTFEILRWVGPAHPFHPNIHPVAPVLCAGLLYPAMELVELVLQIHQVVTWRNVTLVESDALNRDAIAWARSNPELYPIDDRPLRRTSAALSATVTDVGEG